mgnify:CR=1 FL=1
MTLPPASTKFLALLSEFSVQMQLPHDPDALGLEILLGEQSAHVFPHPQHDERLLVLIAVLSLGADQALGAVPASHWLFLHRLNNSAWPEHNWQILVDDDNTLILRCDRDMALTTAKALEELLLDGLERAQSLALLWRDLANSGLDVSNWPLEGASPEAGFIRA